MPNTFEYADWLAMESLDLLESKRSVSQFFNTDYSKEFKLKFPIGDSVRVPYPARFRVRNGLPYNPSPIERTHATINIEEPFGVDFEWDSAEQALKAPRGREKVQREILDPAMATLAQEIDSRCALYAYQHAASVVGALGTNPTTYDATSGAARQIMAELAAPAAGDRGLIVSPSVMRGVKTANIALHNPVTDISKQFRTGIVQAADGFDWYESMSLYRHTAGTWAGAVTVATAPADGATTLALTITANDTVKKGDKFAIAASLPVHPQTRRTFGTATKTFTVLADATSTTTAVTISFSPAMYGPLTANQNVDALPLAGAALTLWPGTTSPSGKVGMVGVALAPNAFGLVGIELEEPKGSSVELVSQKRDPDSGIAVRFIRQWDGQASKMINRFDVQIGMGEFYNDSSAVALAMG